ncbi:alpha/beta hydrolase [Candidatus Enterococcus testudinis]|nr:alpha/beta hydrolase [Enterococcus sp. 8G7_MSG3316]
MLWFAGGIVLIVASIFLAFQLSPRPGAFLIGQMFNQEVTIKDPTAYQESLKNVTVKTDLSYPSDYQKSTFDLYYPQQADAPVPVLFWVHGGGYVGGDKAGVKEFATYIADKTQVAVIALNYEAAPDLQYPGQVLQIQQAVQSLLASAENYPQFDFTHLFFGGDSAGGQIAGQYVALQTNAAYATEMHVKKDIATDNIKGFISYCGPLELKQITSISSDDAFMKFFVHTVAWSLLGRKAWQESDELQKISLIDKLTEAFPPSYLTDGNAYSFQEQESAFADQLTALSIPVTSRFYQNDAHTVTHEYQFDYSTKEANACLAETIAFINNNKLRSARDQCKNDLGRFTLWSD